MGLQNLFGLERFAFGTNLSIKAYYKFDRGQDDRVVYEMNLKLVDAKRLAKMILDIPDDYSSDDGETPKYLYGDSEVVSLGGALQWLEILPD